MLTASRITRAAGILALSAFFWLTTSASASAQAGSFAYDRTGTLHAGIQCVTFDDEALMAWTLVNTQPGVVPFNIEVRIIGTATPGSDPDCAASSGTLEVITVLMPSDDPGTHFCFGDGGDQAGCTNCPCGNNAAVGSGGGCVNSTGAGAVLAAEGSTSLSASDLCFRMSGAVPSSFALLVSGSAQAPNNPMNPCFTNNPGSGVAASAFDGLRCAVTNTQRHGGRSVDVNGEVGALTNAWGNCGGSFPGTAVFVAGQTRYFQSVYRELDTAVCQRGLNTSQGIGISFVP